MRKSPWRRWLPWSIGLATVLAVGAWFVPRWLAVESGSSEGLFFRIRAGMTRQEAVAAIRGCRGIDSLYSEGQSRDGRWFGRIGGFAFSLLPPDGDIARCVLSVVDNGGRELEVMLGPGGTVVGKRLTPGYWEHRAEKALPARIALGAVLALASAWALRGRFRSPSTSSAEAARPSA